MKTFLKGFVEVLFYIAVISMSTTYIFHFTQKSHCATIKCCKCCTCENCKCEGCKCENYKKCH